MKFLWFWGPVLLVMGLIFGASAVSEPGPPPAGLSDKSAHIIAYGVLGATLIRALATGHAPGMTARRVLIATAAAAVYGVTDELHQVFVPGRTPDALDLVADLVGGAAGSFLYAAGARVWHARPWRAAAAPGSARFRA